MYRSDSDTSDDFVSVDHHTLEEQTSISNVPPPPPVHSKIPFTLSSNTPIYELPIFAGQLLFDKRADQGIHSSPLKIYLGVVMEGVNPADAVKFIHEFTTCVFNIASILPTKWERMQLRLLECVSDKNESSVDEDEEDWRTICDLLDERDRMLQYLSGSTDMLISVMQLSHAIDNKPLFLLCCKLFGERVRHGGAVSDVHHPWAALGRGGGGHYHDDNNSFHMNNGSMVGPLPAVGGDLFSSITSSSMAGVLPHPNTNKGNNNESSIPTQSPQDGLSSYFSTANDTSNVNTTDFYGESFTSSLRSSLGGFNSFKSMANQVCGLYHQQAPQAAPSSCGNDPAAASLAAMLDVASALTQTGGGGDVIVSSRRRGVVGDAECCIPLVWHQLPSTDCSSPTSKNDSLPHSTFLGAAYNFPLVSLSNIPSSQSPSSVDGMMMMLCPIRSPFDETANIHNTTHLATTLISTSSASQANLTQLTQVADMVRSFSIENTRCFLRLIYPHHQEQQQDDDEGVSPSSSSALPAPRGGGGKQRAEWKQHASVESPVVGCGSIDGNNQSGSDIPKLPPLPPTNAAPTQHSSHPVVTILTAPPSTSINRCGRLASHPSTQLMVSLVTSATHAAPDVTHRPPTPPTTAQVSPTTQAQASPITFTRGTTVDVHGYIKAVQEHITHGILRDRLPENEADRMVAEAEALMAHAPPPKGSGLVPSLFSLQPWEPGTSFICPSCKNHRSASSKSSHCRICGMSCCVNCCRNRVVGPQDVTVVLPQDKVLEKRNKVCEACFHRYEINKTKWDFLSNALLNSGLSLPEMYILRPVNEGWRCATDYIFFRLRQHFRSFTPVDLDTATPDIRPLLLQSAWALSLHSQPVSFLTRCICWPLLYDAFTAHQITTTRGNIAIHEGRFAVPDITAKAFPSMSPCGPSVTSTHTVHKRLHAIAFKVLIDTCDAKLQQQCPTTTNNVGTPKAVPFEPSLVGCTTTEDKMPASWYGVHLLQSIRDVPTHPTVRYTLPERRRVIIPMGNFEALENKLSRTAPTVSPVQLLQDRCVDLIASGVEKDPRDPLLIALAEGHIPVLFDLLSCPDVRRPAIKALLRLSKASSALQVRTLAECAARVDTFSPMFGDSAYMRAQKQERTPSQSYIGGVLKYVWTPNAFFGGSMRRWVGGGGASSNDLGGSNANEAADNEVLSQWQQVASKGGYYAWTQDPSLTSPDDNALSFTSVRSSLDQIAKRDTEENIHTTTPVSLKHFFAFSTDHMSLAPPLLPQLSQVPHEASPIYTMLNNWHRSTQSRKGCYHGLRPAPSRLYPCDDVVDPKCSETASPHAGLLAALVKLGYDLERVQNKSITTTASSSSAAASTTTTTAVALQRMLAFLHLLELIRLDEAYSPSIAIAAAPPRADANIGNTNMETYWKKAPSLVPPPCSLYELLHTDRHGLISINNNYSRVKILARKLERGTTIGSTSSLMESGPTSPDRVPSTFSTLDSQLYFNQKSEVDKFKIRLVELLREFGLTNETSSSLSKTPMGAVEKIEGTIPYGDFPVHPFAYPFSRDPSTPTLITSIRLSDIKKFNSVQAPWRLALVDEAGVAHPILYKRECLRSDMVVVRSIDALIQILHKEEILESPLPLPTYQVVPIGAESGIIEMVQGKTLKDVLEGHNMSTASRSTQNDSIAFSLNGPRLFRDDMTFNDSRMKTGSVKVPSSAEAISVQRQAAVMCGKMKTSDMEFLAFAGWSRGADPRAVSSAYLGGNTEVPPLTSSPLEPPPPTRGDIPRLPLPACVATLDCFAQVIRPTLNPFITFLSGIVFDRCKTRFSTHAQAVRSWFVTAADEFAQQGGLAGRTEAVATSVVAQEEKDYHKFLEGRLGKEGNGFPPPLSNHYQHEEEIKVLKQFVASVNLSVLTNYIFGLGDRHESNVMFDPNGARFHIDFGYLFGHRPTIEDLVGMKSVRFEPVLKDAIVFALTFLDSQDEHKNWLDDRFRLAINSYNETAKNERKSRVPFMLNRKSRSEASDEAFLVAHMQKCFVPPPTQPFGSLLDDKKFKSNTQSQHTRDTTVPHARSIWPTRAVTLSSGISGSSEIVSYGVVNNAYFKDVSIPLPVPQLSDEVFKGFLDCASRTFAAVRQRHHIFDTIGTHLVNCGAQKGSPVEALVASTAIYHNDVQRWQTEADKTQNGEAHDMGSILDEAAVPPHSPKRPLSHRTEQNQCIETTWARGSGWGCGGVGECDLLSEAVTGMRPFGQSYAFISQTKKNEPQHTTSLSYTRYVRSPFLQTVVSLQRPYLAAINPSTLPPITLQQPLLSQLANRTDPSRHARLLQDVPDNSKMHREWDDAACDPATPLPTHGSEPTYFQKVLLVGVNDTNAEDHFKRNLEDSVSPTLLRDALNKASTTVRDTVRGYV